MSEKVESFYKSLSIDDPYYLKMSVISDLVNVPLRYWKYSSALARRKGKYIMHINETINKPQQWQQFGHEMYHYFFDETNYGLLKETYAVYGETKADYFAYHFCIPTFMLQRLKGIDVYDVMRIFNVEFDFALRRLEMYQNKVLTKGVL